MHLIFFLSEIIITPTQEVNLDDCKTAFVELYDKDRKHLLFARTIDSYTIIGDIAVDFESSEGTRIWSCGRKHILRFNDSYSPVIEGL